MKLTSHSIYWVDGDADPSVSATYTFDKGTSLDLVVKHLGACGQGPTTDPALESKHASLRDEFKKLRHDYEMQQAALQEIQGTYGRLVTEIKECRSLLEKVHNERDTAVLENIDLKRKVDELKLAQTGNTPVVDMRGSKFEITQRFAEGFNPDRVANALREDLTFAASNGPVGEDPKTGEYVYEDLPTPTITPEEYEKLVEVEPEKTPKDLFREVFVTECADIKGTSPSEVLDQAYAVFTNRREEATAYGLQRELGTALTMAIADNLNKEPDDARALFSVKLDSVKGKAEAAKAEEDKSNEPEVLTRFKTAMESALVKAKNSPRQKTVAALALACSKDGKVKLSDMQAAAEVLRKSTGNADDWDALLNKGEKPKSMLETLYKIVSTSLELTVV